MFLSFIIPMYNREKLIGRCLDSILNQGADDVEIICVDDASEDGTKDIVRQYIDKYHNIILLENETNRGLGYARNRGIDIAHGDYIWFVDSDDYICENSIEKLGKYLRTDGLDILYFDILRIDNHKNAICTYDLERTGMVISGQELFCAITKNGTMRYSACSQIYSNEYIKRNLFRFTEGYISEDAYFTLKSLILAEKVVYIQECAYVYEMSAVSITTNSKQIERFKGCFVAYCNMLQLLEYYETSSGIFESLVKVILVYYRFSKRYYNFENEDEIYAWVKNQDDFIYRQFVLFKEQTNVRNYIGELDSNKIDKIREAKCIYVYGIGNVAYELIPMLDDLEKNILAYLVSDNVVKYKKKAIFGVPVVKIGELEDGIKDALVVIATLPKYYGEIENTLRNYGFGNILRLLD